MLEKNSHVVLTDKDIADYNSGVVSERVKQTWGIETLDDLRQIIELQQVYNNSKAKVSTHES